MWPRDFAIWAPQAQPVVLDRTTHYLCRWRAFAVACQLAEECTQEALTQAAEYRDEEGYFVGYEHFENWLTLAARSRACDTLRRQSRHAEQPHTDAAPAAPPDAVRDLSQAVWECLAELDDRDRRVILQKLYESLTFAHIGEAEIEVAADTPAEGERRLAWFMRRGRALYWAAIARLANVLSLRGVELP